MPCNEINICVLLLLSEKQVIRRARSVETLVVINQFCDANYCSLRLLPWKILTAGTKLKTTCDLYRDKSLLTSKFKNMGDREKCLFCGIYDESQPSQKLYKDENYMVFPDIKPAAKHHYLVITREHIRNPKCLTSSHKDTLADLVRIGKQVLEEQGGDTADTVLGFHWPPFNSISHLHLHVISPASEMSFVSRTIFRPNSWWFVTPDYVSSRL